MINSGNLEEEMQEILFLLHLDMDVVGIIEFQMFIA